MSIHISSPQYASTSAPPSSCMSSCVCSRWQAWQTQKRHLLQQKKEVPFCMQKWHWRSPSCGPSLSACWQQQVVRGIGLHWKQQVRWSQSQQLHANLTIFCCWHLAQVSMKSSAPQMYISTWFFSHFSRTGRSLSVVTRMQQLKHSSQSRVQHCWSQQYSLLTCPHLIHPKAFSFRMKSSNPARAKRVMGCSSPQVESEHTSINLHPTQYLFQQLGQTLGHSLSFLQSSQWVRLWKALAQTRACPQEHCVLILAMSDLGFDWSKCSGSSEKQASQMPKLQQLSSQTPSLLTAVLMPQTSQMQLRLAMRWKLKAWPMGQPSLAQGGMRQATQQNSSQTRQQERHSFCSPHWAQFEAIISSQEPMKNSSWWALRQRYSRSSRLRSASSGETKGQARQCSAKARREWRCAWQREGLQGQQKSSCRSGSGATRKGELQRLGQRSSTCLVSETHFMQKMRQQLPRHWTGLMQISQQMPHSYFSRIYFVFRKLFAVSCSFSISNPIQQLQILTSIRKATYN